VRRGINCNKKTAEAQLRFSGLFIANILYGVCVSASMAASNGSAGVDF
jgi:hypothetical protein